MEALSFIVDGEFFAIDVSLVQTVVRKIPVTPVPTAPDEIVGIANFKGRVITVLCLKSLLERSESKPLRHPDQTYNTVIFKPLYGDEDQFGLVIDKSGDLIKISKEDTNPYFHSAEPESYSCFSSIAEIDGTLYRMVDLHQISERYTAVTDNGGVLPETYETEA